MSEIVTYKNNTDCVHTNTELFCFFFHHQIQTDVCNDTKHVLNNIDNRSEILFL